MPVDELNLLVVKQVDLGLAIGMNRSACDDDRLSKVQYGF